MLTLPYSYLFVTYFFQHGFLKLYRWIYVAPEQFFYLPYRASLYITFLFLCLMVDIYGAVLFFLFTNCDALDIVLCVSMCPCVGVRVTPALNVLIFSSAGSGFHSASTGLQTQQQCVKGLLLVSCDAITIIDLSF